MRDNVIAQIIAHLIGIPAHAGEKILHRIRRAIPGMLGQLPAVRALNRRK
jgi:hypothetical protein